MALTPVTAMYAQAQQANALYNETARKQAAFNALRRTYGDMAGDPAAALRMQEYGFNEDANPMRLEGMQIANATNQQAYDFNEQANPLRLDSARIANDTSQQAYDYNEQANPVKLESGRLANRSAETKTVEEATALRRRALVDGARYMKKRIGEGVDAGTAFDEIAPYLPASDDQKAQLRETLASNPGELDTFLQTFAAGDDMEAGLTPIPGVDEQGNPVLFQPTKSGRAVQTQLPPGVTVSKEPIRMDAGDRIILLDPITRHAIGVVPKGGAPSADQSPTVEGAPVGVVRPGDGQAPVQMAPTPGSKREMEVQQAAAEAEEQELAQEATAGAVAAPVLRTFKRALNEYVPQFTQGTSTVSATQRYAKQFIPGTPENLFTTEIITPLSNISLERLRQMREQSATGASGLGQVTEAEHKMLQNSWGAVDVTLPPDVLGENLRQAHNTFLDVLYGTKKQRERLVAQGKLNPAVSAELDKQYQQTEYDQFGNRRQEETGALGDMSDDQLRQRYDALFGGER